ncbi:hypothetical protein [Paraburkholderia strydomiana]|uniref:hypothetical protein n=1 Tax=Paraburkholderia strydomiana TaxID=1245417 RepID=UPI003EBF49DE
MPRFSNLLSLYDLMSCGRLSLMQNNKHIHQYNGYSVSPSAHQLPDGWFAANLLLTRGDARNAEPVSYQFDALDYFDSETQALGHASAWARGWVDSRG